MMESEYTPPHSHRKKTWPEVEEERWDSYMTACVFAVIFIVIVVTVLVVLGVSLSNNNNNGGHHHDDDDDDHGGSERDVDSIKDVHHYGKTPLNVNTDRFIQTERCDLYGRTVQIDGIMGTLISSSNPVPKQQTTHTQSNNIEEDTTTESTETNNNVGVGRERSTLGSLRSTTPAVEIPRVEDIDRVVTSVLPKMASKRVGNEIQNRTNLFWVWGLFVSNCLFKSELEEEDKGEYLYIIKMKNKYAPILDGRCVYGSFENMNLLRTFQEGKIKMTRSAVLGDYIPEVTSTKPYFNIADSRFANSIPLLSLYTLFLREHNLVATELHDRNPDWDDEMLYWMARRIITSEIQAITFEEWLPSFYATHEERHEYLTKFHELFSTTTSHDSDDSSRPRQYNEINSGVPEIYGEFTTIARQALWSAVPFKLSVISPSTGDVVQQIPIYKLLHNMEFLKMGTLDALILGMVRTPMNEIDWMFESSLIDTITQTEFNEYHHNSKPRGNSTTVNRKDEKVTQPYNENYGAGDDNDEDPENDMLEATHHSSNTHKQNPLSWFIEKSRNQGFQWGNTIFMKNLDLRPVRKWDDLNHLNSHFLQKLKTLYKYPENIDPMLISLLDPDISSERPLGTLLTRIWEMQLVECAKRDPHFFLVDYTMKRQVERLKSTRISDIILRNTKLVVESLFPYDRLSLFLL